jgi:sugar O-acyltransferase (sialic acid O-acetyltransferase NeuD family)
VLQWARDAWPEHAGRINGFLSDDPHRLDGKNCSLPIIADPRAFTPTDGDYLVLAIGMPGIRRMVTEDILARGGKFLTLIHPTALVAESASVEDGAVICPYAIVSDSAYVGRFALLNYYSSLGHDASASDFAVLSPYATLGGAASVAEDVFLGLHAAVAPGRRLGRDCQASIGAAVMHDTAEKALVFGVPGIIRPRLSVGY